MHLDLIAKLGWSATITICFVAIAVGAEPPDAKRSTTGEATPKQDDVAKAADARPSPEVFKLRKQIRDHLAKGAGKPIPRPQQKITDPVSNWNLAKDYRDAKKDRTKLYWLFGRDLALVDRLLADEDPAIRRSGLSIAQTIVMYVQTDLDDDPLGVGICDAYLSPHFGLANPVSSQFTSERSILQTAVAMYGKAKAYERQEAALRISLDRCEDDNSRDAHRMLIAKALRGQKKFGDAQKVLETMSTQSFRNASLDYAKEIAQEQAEQLAKGKAAKVGK